MTPYPLYRRLCSGLRFKNPMKRKKIYFLQFLLPIDGGKQIKGAGVLWSTLHTASLLLPLICQCLVLYTVSSGPPAIMCQKCSAACRYISITLAVPVMGTFFPLGLTSTLLHVKCFGQVVLRDLPQALERTTEQIYPQIRHGVLDPSP